jgi:large subunit ribosomal protein L21
MTVAQLKEIAKAKGITGISAMKKSDLISALS